MNIWESRDIYFRDSLTGFILESNKFYRTTDGGITFNLVPNITGFSIAANFSNYADSIIFITGFKTYRSIDGGLSWLDFSELTGIRINELNLLGAGLGYAIGELGLCLKYLDGTLPVELINFIASVEKLNVNLIWSTATEINNQGFFVERKKQNEINWKSLAFIEGAGTTTSTNHYAYTDQISHFSNYKYRLRQIDYDGTENISKEIKIEFSETPSKFSLSQNYPNPFNPNTKIAFFTDKSGIVKLVVYDMLGEKIKVLFNDIAEAGKKYEINFSGDELPSGTYFYELIGQEKREIKKMLYLK